MSRCARQNIGRITRRMLLSARGRSGRAGPRARSAWQRPRRSPSEIGVVNNARTSPGGGPFDHYERWQRVLAVNLWGVINGVHAFTQAMIDQKTPGAIVNMSGNFP
jgi:NAD(P)-dependent dehydrogenase (short-subunit alcohol dehydrogenase family)